MAHLKKNYTSQGKRYKVFLSHSGAQNGFVEQLCVDLERCDRQSFCDKRGECFPIGKDFASIIFGAIEQCEVGVVFLSQEYFTSTWPMLELLAMTNVKKRNPNFTILPIYLGISMRQFREDHHRKRWLSVWKSWAEGDSRIDVRDLESALRWLGTIHGLNYHSEMGEVGFREEIVEVVCKLVPPSTRFEDSYIQGRSRLCKVIHEWIKESKPSSLHGVHVVGLHGVRGIGKTTLCKAMCNDVSEQGHRKVAHVELGKQSEEGLLKEVLRRLTDMNLDYLGAMNVDEYHYRLMRDMINFNVFLTIDNVSSATMEQALTLLQANYGHGSVVLVTARSLDELLSMGIGASECMKMPELELEEAESLFLYHAKCVPPSYSSNKDDHELISSCVQRCYMKKGDGVSGSYYLPLALQTLGKRLRRVGYHPKQWWLLLDEFDPFGEPQHHIFSTSRRSFASAIIPQDQASISDGYSVSEDYFSHRLEDKTMGPEGDAADVDSIFQYQYTFVFQYQYTSIFQYQYTDVLDAWPTTLPANTRNQQSYQPVSHDHDVLLGSLDGALKFTMVELNIITGNFSESCRLGKEALGQFIEGSLRMAQWLLSNKSRRMERMY